MLTRDQLQTAIAEDGGAPFDIAHDLACKLADEHCESLDPSEKDLYIHETEQRIIRLGRAAIFAAQTWGPKKAA